MQTCVVCDWEIKDAGTQATLGSREVVVCCDDCAREVKANPARYQAKAAEADRAEIRAHIDSLFRAYIDRDLEAIRRGHTEDWRGFQVNSPAIVRGIGSYMGAAQQVLETARFRRYEMVDQEIQLYGDVAVVNGTGGLVEAVNLRTIVLRDEEGTVHVFPNGEVKTLANKSKDFAYYVISIGVPWDEDTDRVIDALNAAGESLLADPAFRVHILEPIDVYGIDAFETAQVIVKGRIKTVPQKQWLVGRELRKRIAKLFRERGIRMPGLPVIQMAPPSKPQ